MMILYQDLRLGTKHNLYVEDLVLLRGIYTEDDLWIQPYSTGSSAIDGGDL